MKTSIAIALVAVPLSLQPILLTAHHSYTVVFDASKTITLSGKLTKVDWRNPHIEISIDARGRDGRVEPWVIEGGPPRFFTTSKVSRSEFEKAIGEDVTLDVYRARDGNLLGSLLKITFADGRSVKSDPSA